ncbi:MAG: hypothetical protein KY475_18155 [Planctomycetes bacterium]|nr:hypothetical protein [Planctomycetota bacterium]
MSLYHLSRRRWLVLAASLVLVFGCGPPAAPSLDEAVARSSLSTFLEAWKRGERPESLREQSPTIIAGAPEWSAGMRLVSYRLLAPVTIDGSNLHAPVEIELEDGAGARSKHDVLYIVGTSPAITIFPE